MKVYEYILRIKDQASDKISRFNRSLNSSRSGVDRLGGSLNKASQSSGSFGLSLGALSRFLGPAALGAALGAGALKASNLARELEQTKISFEVLVGSARDGRALLQDTIDLASVTPFTSRDLQSSAKLLLGYGVSTEKIIPTLKMLGDISGGNADRLHLLSLAFAQTQAAGRLTGQDLLQMVNSGFNPLQIISEKTGISMGTLKEKMEKGAISAQMVEAAFKMATEEGGRFFNMMEKQSQTFEGRMSTMKDKFEIFLTGIGTTLNTAFSPILDKIIAGLDRITDKTGSFANEQKKEVDTIRKLVTSTLPLVERFSVLKEKGVMGRTADETKEFVKLFHQLKNDLPAGAVYDGTGKKIGFSADSAKDFIAGQKDNFIRKSDESIKSLTNELRSVDYKIRINQADLRFQHEEKGRNDTYTEEKYLAKIESLNSSLQEKNKERNRILELIDQVKFEKQNAFMALPKDAATTGNPFAGLTDKDKDNKDKKKHGTDLITGGGKQAVNVTINLENLIGTQEINATNIKESVTEMEKLVMEALTRVINSANYAQAQ